MQLDYQESFVVGYELLHLSLTPSNKNFPVELNGERFGEDQRFQTYFSFPVRISHERAPHYQGRKLPQPKRTVQASKRNTTSKEPLSLRPQKGVKKKQSSLQRDTLPVIDAHLLISHLLLPMKLTNHSVAICEPRNNVLRFNNVLRLLRQLNLLKTGNLKRSHL